MARVLIVAGGMETALPETGHDGSILRSVVVTKQGPASPPAGPAMTVTGTAPAGTGAGGAPTWTGPDANATQPGATAGSRTGLP